MEIQALLADTLRLAGHEVDTASDALLLQGSLGETRRPCNLEGDRRSLSSRESRPR